MTSEDLKPAFVGTWELEDSYSTKGEERVDFPLGKKVIGRINYDNSGRMAAQLMATEREQFSSRDPREVSDSEYRAAYQTYTSYFGTYNINAAESSVTHHVEAASAPSWPGHKQVRFFELDGDRMTLRTPPMRGNDGAKSVHTLVWRKVV